MDWLISYPEDFGHGTSADLKQNHKVITTDFTDTVGIAVVATELGLGSLDSLGSHGISFVGLEATDATRVS